MCAIIGIASTKPVTNKAWLGKGSKAMAHRGPDASGEWWSADDRIGFAHRRLSLVDLRDIANQPMSDNKNQVTVVFNGEIYNYLELKNELLKYGLEFKSNSDTEVILNCYKKWGIECIKKLRGMFAFAIYDNEKKIVFLARDIVGEKPLFYHLGDGQIRFSSELKGLFADTSLIRKVDYSALDCYLTLGYVPHNLCILQNFQKLPAANFLIFDIQTSKVTLESYWHLPKFDYLNSKRLEQKQLIDHLEILLHKSISQQLIADTPIGIFLSGGVDSSLITAIAANITSNIKTFTIGFPDSDLDESNHAKIIASHFGTSHTSIIIDDPIDEALITKVLEQFDEPLADSSGLPMAILSRSVRGECKAVLGGDGADELFGGYTTYSTFLSNMAMYSKTPESLKSWLKTSSSFLPLGFKGKNWLRNISLDFKKDILVVGSYFDREAKDAIFDNFKLNSGFENFLNNKIPNEDDPIQRLTRMDFMTYLPDDILAKVDRSSMLFSLEVRAPWLNHEIIDFAYRMVPGNQKVNEYNRKIILKEMALRILPKKFDIDRKQGFSIPLAKWLKKGGRLRRFFEDIVFDKSSIINQEFAKSLFNGLDRGRSNSERIYSLVMLEIWRRKYNITFD